MVEADSPHKPILSEFSILRNTFKSVDIEPVKAFERKIKFVSYKLPVSSSEIDSNERLSEINEAKRPKVEINANERREVCDISKVLNEEKRNKVKQFIRKHGKLKLNQLEAKYQKI